MRIFAASLATETNTFSPIPTSRRSFEASFYAPPGKHPDEPKLCTAPLYVARRRAKEEGFTLIEGSCFWAEPSGTVVRDDYESMRDEILGQLKAAMPVDAVLLGLHGAFVAEGYDDVEGDLLERVRAIVGETCVIGCEYDPHCHMTEKRIRLATVSTVFKEYPHVDFLERGEELVELVLQTLRGKIKPVASLYDARMWDFFPTTVEPMRSFVDRIKALEGKDGILHVSIAHGFLHADVPDMGTRVLVYSDGRKADGDRLARKLGAEIFANRGKWCPPTLDMAGGILGGARPQRPARHHRRALRQRRRRGRLRLHAGDPRADPAQGRQVRGRAGVGPDRRGVLHDGGARRAHGAALRRQGGGRVRPAGRCRWSRCSPPSADGWQMFGSARVGRRRYGGGAHRRRRRDPDRPAHAGLRHRALHPARPRSRRATA